MKFKRIIYILSICTTGLVAFVLFTSVLLSPNSMGFETYYDNEMEMWIIISNPKSSFIPYYDEERGLYVIAETENHDGGEIVTTEKFFTSVVPENLKEAVANGEIPLVSTPPASSE